MENEINFATMKLFVRQSELESRERYTFRLHTLYMTIEGIILGVLALNEFVFIKSLHGSNYQLSFLFQFSMVLFLFLVFINEFIKRIKNRKLMLRVIALLTRLPLLLLLLFPDNVNLIDANNYYHYIFLGIFLVYFSGNIVIYPNINFLLKTNYSHQNFGRLYSYATSTNKIVMLVVTFAYGYLLDFDNYAFRYIIPVIGLLGVVSVFILSEIKYPESEKTFYKLSIFQSAKKSILEMKNILLSNVPYRHFEMGFMLYGISFMMSVTVITIYFYEHLDLNYASVAFYRNSYNILAIILLPFFGKLLGEIDPRKFAVYTYTSMALYIFFLMMTTYLPYSFETYDITIYYTLIFYVLFHGVFAASMVLLWNIGSSYFCRPEEAGTYQSLHLSLTGARALVAPLFGVVFYEIFGFTFTFILTIACLMTAVGLMVWSYRVE